MAETGPIAPPSNGQRKCSAPHPTLPPSTLAIRANLAAQTTSATVIKDEPSCVQQVGGVVSARNFQESSTLPSSNAIGELRAIANTPALARSDNELADVDMPSPSPPPQTPRGLSSADFDCLRTKLRMQDEIAGEETNLAKCIRKGRRSELSLKQREAVRQAQNRASAKRSRLRKKELALKQQQRNLDLERENENLKNTVAELKERLNFLETFSCKCKCPRPITPNKPAL